MVNTAKTAFIRLLFLTPILLTSVAAEEALVASAPPENQLQLSPTRIDFGRIAAGDASEARTITLTNRGSTPLALTGLVLPADVSASHSCNKWLAQNESCTVQAVLLAKKHGVRNGRFVIETTVGRGEVLETAQVLLSTKESHDKEMQGQIAPSLQWEVPSGGKPGG